MRDIAANGAMGTISDDPGETSPNGLGQDQVLDWLQRADLRLEGRIAWSSNATFLCRLLLPDAAGEDDQEIPLRAVYKPRQGERPLWDFPEGTLCLRERGAWLVDQALGWDLVPPTLLREGPYGFGAVQAFIPHDPQEHYLAAEGWDRRALRRLAAFDALINNADRKSGHVLADAAGRLWAIDHGICFHEEEKLRTVLWDFGGQKIPSELLDRLLLSPSLLADLQPYLSQEEISALCTRAESIRKKGTFPRQPRDRRAMPWPPL